MGQYRISSKLPQLSTVPLTLAQPTVKDAQKIIRKARNGKFALGQTKELDLALETTEVKSNKVIESFAFSEICACKIIVSGPLTWTEPHTSKVVLIGVVSYFGWWVEDNGSMNGTWTCVSNNSYHSPTVYSRVQSALPWIQEVTGNCNDEINW